MSFQPTRMGPPKSRPGEIDTAPKTTSSFKTQYLVLYNLLSLVLWGNILFRLTLAFFLAPASINDPTHSKHPFLAVAHFATFDLVRWTQSLAVLEVLHALVGLVRTSPFTTAMQVASRLLLVWGVLEPFGKGLLVDGSGTLLQKSQDLGLGGVPGLGQAVGVLSRLGAGAGGVVGAFGGGKELSEVQQNQAAYVGMLLAWSVTECIRYLYFIFYASSASGKAPAPLTWLRYNTFFVLYPLGISCECWLIYRSIPFAAQISELYALALKVILGIYVPGSYILYSHMIAQRRKVMKGKGKARL